LIVGQVEKRLHEHRLLPIRGNRIT
jgi:hypothetical protein